MTDSDMYFKTVVIYMGLGEGVEEACVTEEQLEINLYTLHVHVRDVRMMEVTEHLQKPMQTSNNQR